MIPQEVYAVLFFFGAMITFSLFCWWLCYYVDSEKDYIRKACRRKEQEYYNWERKQTKHYKKRKDLGKML